MTLHFIDRLPVLGYREVDGRDLAFSWVWHTPCLRVTFTEADPHLLGRVAHLDDRPRLVPAPDNLDWLGHDAPDRALAVLDHAVSLWSRGVSIRGPLLQEERRSSHPMPSWEPC